MTQSASEDCSLFRKEGADMADHDHEIGIYHPVESKEPLFTNDMNGVPVDRREPLAHLRYVHAYAGYRRRMVQLGSKLLAAIGPEEGIDFEILGQAWAMMDVEDKACRQVTPDECCGLDCDMQDLFVRNAWIAFTKAYYQYVRSVDRKLLPAFRLLLPRKSASIAEAAA